LYQSNNGGDTWESTLHPGFFLDPKVHQFKLYDFRAAADPTLRSGPAGVSFYSGISFKKDKSVQLTVRVDLRRPQHSRENDPMPFKFVRTIIVDLKQTPEVYRQAVDVRRSRAARTDLHHDRPETMKTAAHRCGPSTWWGKIVTGWLSKRWPGLDAERLFVQTGAGEHRPHRVFDLSRWRGQSRRLECTRSRRIVA
jgi:hypothetical protein